MLLDIDYIKDGVKAIRKNKENINISKLCNMFDVSTHVIYENKDFSSMKYNRLMNLQKMVIYCEDKKIIFLNGNSYHVKRTKELNDALKAYELINKLQQKTIIKK